MSEKFSSLRAWLGLNLESKPTYYELLGLPNFESEPPIIADAADRAEAKVAPHLQGPRKSHAEKLLGDLKSVRAVLLSADKRRAYDDQLRKQLGAAIPPPAGGIESLIAPGVEAADSPTMMLPPGALSMSAGANSLLGGSAPAGFPPQAPPGYAPGGFPPMVPYPNAPPTAAPGMPYGGMPMPAAMPGLPGAAPYAAGGMAAPYAQPPGMGVPYAQPPGMAMPSTPGYPQAMGTPPGAYAAPGFEYGAPAAAIPTAAPGYAAPGYAAPAAAEPSFAPKQSTMRVRKATARQQKNSNIMIALLVLGGAVAILLIVIFVAGQKDEPQDTAKNGKPTTKTEASQNSETDSNSSIPTPAYYSNNDVRVPPTDNGGASSGADSSMSPSGNSTSVAMNTPVGTVPDFNTVMPAPTATMPAPSATGSVAAPMPSTPTPALPGALPGVMSEVVAMAPTLPEDAARAKSIPIMFKGIRTALRARDYGGAEERALVASVSADTPALVTEATEYSRIVELLGGFWKAVNEGVKTLKEGDEVTVNGQTGPVVRHDDTTLVVKVAGKDVPFAVNKLVAASAAQMAERALPKDDPATKLVVGTFLAFDNPTEKARGQALVAEAGASGLEVSELLRIIQLPE